MEQKFSFRCLFVLQVVVSVLAAATGIVQAETPPQIQDEGQEKGHRYDGVPASSGRVEMNIDPTTGAQKPTTVISSPREGSANSITTATENDNDENNDDDYYEEGDEEEEEEDDEEEFDFYHYPWDDFPYYREEFDDEPRWPPTCNPSEGVVEECEDPEDFVLDEFIVAGKNIAEYGRTPKPTVFELYEDFDISSMIKGDEGWKDLLYLRRSLERPSLSWYVDKVARKKWLTERGYPQPEIYFMKYKYELFADAQHDGESSSSSSSVTQPPTNISQHEFKQLLATEIQKNLPTEHSFAAKPTHTSMTMGLWLVDHTPVASVEDGHVKQQIHTSFTQRGMRLYSSDDDERFEWDPQTCAGSLAEGLFRKPAGIESWALHNVHPGVVVEELLSFQEDPSLPPQELCFFVIWGRVYVAQVSNLLCSTFSL